jgi:hypothetical protein
MTAQAMPVKVFGAQPRRRTGVIIADCISKPFHICPPLIDVRSENIRQHLFPI